MRGGRSAGASEPRLIVLAAMLACAATACDTKSTPADAGTELIACDAPGAGGPGLGDAGAPPAEVAAALVDFAAAVESIDSTPPACGQSLSGVDETCTTAGSINTSGSWMDCPDGGSGTSDYRFVITLNNCSDQFQGATLLLDGSVVMSGTVTQRNGAITSWTATLSGNLAFSITLPGYNTYSDTCGLSLTLSPALESNGIAGTQVSGSICGDTIACFQLGTLPADGGVRPADAGATDAGLDSGEDVGADAGATDAGTDGEDAGMDIDGGPCSCNTTSGCSGPADAGFYSTCPGGTICDFNAGECVSSRYTAAGDGTVTDNVTGLVWQQDVPANPCPSDGTGGCSWTDAQAYCAGLSLGGMTGWTLPTLPQLFSLVDVASFPTIDSASFPNTPTNIAFWSSSADGTADAWVVSFSNGNNDGYSTNASFTNSVRCVQ